MCDVPHAPLVSSARSAPCQTRRPYPRAAPIWHSTLVHGSTARPTTDLPQCGPGFPTTTAWSSVLGAGCGWDLRSSPARPPAVPSYRSARATPRSELPAPRLTLPAPRTRRIANFVLGPLVAHTHPTPRPPKRGSSGRVRVLYVGEQTTRACRRNLPAQPLSDTSAQTRVTATVIIIGMHRASAARVTVSLSLRPEPVPVPVPLDARLRGALDLALVRWTQDDDDRRQTTNIRGCRRPEHRAPTAEHRCRYRYRYRHRYHHPRRTVTRDGPPQSNQSHKTLTGHQSPEETSVGRRTPRVSVSVTACRCEIKVLSSEFRWVPPPRYKVPRLKSQGPSPKSHVSGCARPSTRPCVRTSPQSSRRAIKPPES